MTDRKLKIVQLTPYAMDRHGGVQSHVRDLSTWLCAQGHEVRIVAPPSPTATEDSDAEKHSEANLMTVGTARPWSLHGTGFEVSRATRQQRQTAARNLHTWGADVVHVHTPWTPLLAWQMWRALKLPTIASFHATLPESDGFDPMSSALRRVGHYFNKRVHRVVVPSQAPFEQWQTAGADPLPTILPPAIDLSAWQVAAQDATKAPQFRVVYMGRLEARKGVDVLLSAWKAVQPACPDAELIIAGTGEEEQALRTQCETDALQNVAFVPPPDAARAKSLIASADVFAAPAIHGESFGLVLTEAMAAGAVPVAAANAGFATVLTGEGTELMVPPGDPQALAAKLIDLAQNPARRAMLQTWAQRHATRFDVQTVGPEYVALYTQALEKASPNG